MNLCLNASYSATACQYRLRHSENFAAKITLPENLLVRIGELATGIVVLGSIGLWLFVI